MTKDLIIIALLIALIYLYYQNKKLKGLPSSPNVSTRTVFEVGEDQEELIAERDSAIRSKNEAEQEVLSLSNKLKLKNQEVSRKEEQITKLKKEKSDSEIALNKKIAEVNQKLKTQQGITSTLNQEKLKLQEKYSKQGKLLDEEQTDNNQLNEKIAQLEKKLEQLKENINSKYFDD